jgi:uncharacterized protein YeaO (DUF488 family)
VAAEVMTEKTVTPKEAVVSLSSEPAEPDIVVSLKEGIGELWTAVTASPDVVKLVTDKFVSDIKPAILSPDFPDVLLSVDITPLKEVLRTGKLTAGMAQKTKDMLNAWLVNLKFKLPVLGEKNALEIAKIAIPVGKAVLPTVIPMVITNIGELDKATYEAIMPKLTLPEKVKAVVAKAHKFGLDNKELALAIVTAFQTHMLETLQGLLQELLDKKAEEIAAMDLGAKAQTLLNVTRKAVNEVLDTLKPAAKAAFLTGLYNLWTDAVAAGQEESQKAAAEQMQFEKVLTEIKAIDYMAMATQIAVVLWTKLLKEYDQVKDTVGFIESKYNEFRPAVIAALKEKKEVAGINLLPVAELMETGKFSPAMAAKAKEMANEWLIKKTIKNVLFGKDKAGQPRELNYWKAANFALPIALRVADKLYEAVYAAIMAKAGTDLPANVKAVAEAANKLALKYKDIFQTGVKAFQAELLDMGKGTIQDLLDKKAEDLATMNTGEKVQAFLKGARNAATVVANKIEPVKETLKADLYNLYTSALASKGDILKINYNKLLEDIKAANYSPLTGVFMSGLIADEETET